MTILTLCSNRNNSLNDHNACATSENPKRNQKNSSFKQICELYMHLSKCISRFVCSFYLTSNQQLISNRNFHISYSSLRKSNWAYKKVDLYKPLYVQKVMAELDPKIKEILEPLRKHVKEQGLFVY